MVGSGNTVVKRPMQSLTSVATSRSASTSCVLYSGVGVVFPVNVLSSPGGSVIKQLNLRTVSPHIKRENATFPVAEIRNLLGEACEA